jgi:hypothetical protein
LGEKILRLKEHGKPALAERRKLQQDSALMTKSGADVDAAKARPRIESRAEAGSEALEVEGETAMDLYITLELPACSLKVRSSSEALGRPRRLSSKLHE